MECCLKMDVLNDFKTLYDATMKNIRFQEREAFIKYIAVVRQIQMKVCIVTRPPNPSRLADLYRTGRAVYDRFHAFIEGVVSVSSTGFVYKNHGERAKMKGIYRILEKGLFKYNDSWKEGDELDLSQVHDVVRGAIVDTRIAGLADIAEHILKSDEVTVCRVKDRFSEPSSSGWTDLMLNFYFNDDNEVHVCEVQLVHYKMLSQRTTQEGHGAYNTFRSASELLLFRKRARKMSKKFSSQPRSKLRNKVKRKVYPTSLLESISGMNRKPPTNETVTFESAVQSHDNVTTEAADISHPEKLMSNIKLDPCNEDVGNLVPDLNLERYEV